MWKEHIKNLLGLSPKITDKPITKITNSQPDIKLTLCTQEECHIVLTKMKSRKTTDRDEIPPEVWKTRKFNDLLLQFYNAV